MKNLEWFDKIKDKLPNDILAQFVEVENKSSELSNLLRSWVTFVDMKDKYLDSLADIIEKHETGVEGYETIHDFVIGYYVEDLRDLNMWRKDLKTGAKEGGLHSEGLLRYKIEETGRAVEKLIDMLEEHYKDKGVKVTRRKIAEFFPYKEYYERMNELINKSLQIEKEYHINLMKSDWALGPSPDGLLMKKWDDKGKGEKGELHFGILRKGKGPIIYDRKEGSRLGDTSDDAFIKKAEFATFEELYDNGWKVD